MNLLIKLRNLLYIIRIFYWLSFKGVVKAYSQGNVALAQQNWAKYTWEFFKSKLYKCASSEEMRREKTVMLTNHRSQADFWIHGIITQYTCNFISRLAVGIVFFIFGIFGNKVIWFFNRSGNIDHDKQGQQNIKIQSMAKQKVYDLPKTISLGLPGGSQDAINYKSLKEQAKNRSHKGKQYLIQYAYRQKIPVQMLMSFGNQTIFNEKKLEMGWNKKVYYSFSKVYNPETFQNEGEFVEHMKDQFCNFFDQIWRIYTEGGAVQEVEPLRNQAD